MNSDIWCARYAALPGRIERLAATTRFYYKNGEKVASIGPSGELSLFGEFGRNNQSLNETKIINMRLTSEQVFDDALFVKLRDDARLKCDQFWKEFKAALFEYHDIGEHPKREKFFEILRSNKSSPYEIIGEAEDWVELLK